MISLDLRTIVFSNVLDYIVCLLVISLLWRQSRKRFAGTDFWVFNFALQTAALFLIILRGSIPDWMSMALANTLVIAGALLGYMGLGRFVGKKSSQVHNYVLLAAFASVHTYFVLVQPNLPARNLNLAVGLLIICFQCAWLLLFGVDPGMRRLTRVVGMVFGAYCLVSIVRIAEFFIGTHPANDYFQSGAFEAFVLVSYQMLLILLTYSLVLMFNKRLLAEVKTQEEKFAKAFHSSPYAITLTQLSDGQIIEVNDAFLNITGYQSAEVMGKTTVGLHLWDKEEDRVVVVNELSNSGKVQGREFQFRKKSGEMITGFFAAEIIPINNREFVLSSISDVTERKRAEETLERSEDVARRLAEEQAVIGEIGHIVSSTLDIDSVYDRFAQTARKLVDFDRISINIIDGEKNTLTVAYSWGTAVEGRNSKGMIPFLGSGTEEVFRTRKSVFIQTEDENELANRFPAYFPNFIAGIRSALFTPLFVGKEMIGSLSFLSKRPRAYAEWDREIGEHIGYQIAGAIANAKLYHERKKAEEGVLASLREKEVLLKEIHHRVKNNLQVISSLLHLQSPSIQDPLALEIFRESQNRVRSLALVHERLLRSPDLASVDFGEYIRNIVSSLFSSYHTLAQGVSSEVEAEEIYLGVDLATPCGLILNELISNALKHAFPEGRRGKISISFHRREKGQYVMRVRDDGIGFPPALDIGHTETLGLQLVDTLSKQLAGTLELNREGGADFTLTFGGEDSAGGKHG
jgi:PAS domain S-box-containing protein